MTVCKLAAAVALSSALCVAPAIACDYAVQPNTTASTPAPAAHVHATTPATPTAVAPAPSTVAAPAIETAQTPAAVPTQPRTN